MYTFPKLKQGCSFAAHANGVRFEYCGQTFNLALDNTALINPVVGFISALDGTRRLADLRETADGLTPAEIDQLLTLLDRQYCIVDAWSMPLSGSSGTDFLAELEELYHCKWLPEQGETEFATLLFDGTAPKPVLIGWTFEYYHVTRMAHDSIAPALPRAHGEFGRRLHKYFLEEYRHDKLLATSLVALGYSNDQISESIPLSYTAAIMNLLASWARVDLLSFMASLFVFERSDVNEDIYLEALRKYALPSHFIDGQATHNAINIGEDHGAITRELFRFIDYVSPSDKRRIIANLRVLQQSMKNWNAQILAYYSDPYLGIPRTRKSPWTSSILQPAQTADEPMEISL